ncbi:MAG: AsmA-like C-terminal region-containing protein [Methylacidiphilales bacterium]|nr:AsmA-like C-terminal region-containing protein [Candidatus Methylacidiphilales bacterium]
MKSASVRWIVGIVVALMLLAGGVGVWAWMKITGLREALVDDLGTEIGAKVEVSSFDVDVWHGEIHAAGIRLENTRPDAPWEKGSISQATARFHLQDIFASKMPLSIDVSSWTLLLRPSQAALASETMPSGTRGWMQVTELTAHEGEVTVQLSGERQILVHGVAFQASDNGAEMWTTELQASSVEAGALMADTISVEIRGEQDKVTFSNLRMQCAQGFITGNGEMELNGGHDAKVTLKATDVPVTMLVAVPWQVQLTGLADGDLNYTGDDNSGAATGQIVVSQGKFNVLPWLGKVTALVSLPDITGVEVDKATSDFSWKDGTLHLTNIDVRKNDVTRIGGDVEIDSGGQVDGHLKLGLPSTVTARWPDLQTKIFSEQHDDFNWADVHLTGTPDHLQEDLTARLVALGAQEGSGLINQATQKTMDLLKGFLSN